MNHREDSRKHTKEPVDEAALPPLLALMHPAIRALPPESINDNAAPPNAPLPGS